MADAGQLTGAIYQMLLSRPDTIQGALSWLAMKLFLDVGTGGAFDYQRRGNQILGIVASGFAYTHYRDFRNVSNFNVGVYCQQAGLSLHHTLTIAGGYAGVMSSNAAPGAPYGLDPDTKKWIEIGFETSAIGAFRRP